MFIGIDVGGTYTDAVIIDQDNIIGKAKVPTQHDNLLESLLEALDKVTLGINPTLIQRIVISTTLITNLITEKKYDPVALVLIPGPGLSPKDYPFEEDTFILNGGIDYRGRQIIPLDDPQLQDVAELISKSYHRAAVVGKFSSRNNCHEMKIGQIFDQFGVTYELGHKVSGQLNFLRRAATTMLTAATKKEYIKFADTVKQAIETRKIHAPIYILKADGGTLPLDISKNVPVETIFSGPAASTMGAMALAPKDETTIVIDIGGTTTDLSLVLSGEPLMASKGAEISGLYTSIKSFAVRSIPIGGDSAVVIDEDKLKLLPERKGPAYCFGGPVPTPTDAMRVLGLSKYGDKNKAEKGLQELAIKLGTDVQTVAQDILNKVTKGIVDTIEHMFLSWEQEPAYRIWELLQKTKIRPQNVMGVGAAASGIIPGVASEMNCNPIIPDNYEVANALGAAVAQPTLKVTLRVDTGEGSYTVMENGHQGKINETKKFSEEDAIKLAKDNLLEMADNMILKLMENEIEVIKSEVFNMVRGFYTEGRIYDIEVQTPRKILSRFHREGVNN